MHYIVDLCAIHYIAFSPSGGLRTPDPPPRFWGEQLGKKRNELGATDSRKVKEEAIVSLAFHLHGDLT